MLGSVRSRSRPRRRTARTVMSALIRNNTTSAMSEVSRPPASSTNPVPSKIPHAFDVAHDARNQVAGFVRVVERKTGRREMCFCTFSRSSVIKRCAAFDNSWVSENDVMP